MSLIDLMSLMGVPSRQTCQTRQAHQKISDFENLFLTKDIILVKVQAVETKAIPLVPSFRSSTEGSHGDPSSLLGGMPVSGLPAVPSLFMLAYNEAT